MPAILRHLVRLVKLRWQAARGSQLQADEMITELANSVIIGSWQISEGRGFRERDSVLDCAVLRRFSSAGRSVEKVKASPNFAATFKAPSKCQKTGALQKLAHFRSPY